MGAQAQGEGATNMTEAIGIVAAMLSLGTPLVIAGTGEAVLERTGVLNIGIEGMMLAGAFAGFFVCHATGNPWFGIGAAVGTGILLAMVSSVLVLGYAVDQVVVGTGINLFSLGATGSLFVAQFGETGRLVSVQTVPKVGGVWALNPLMLIAVCLVLGAWFILKKTNWGLAARATGESPEATSAAGFSPIRIRTQAFLFAGATAGLAGAYLSLAQTNSFAENMTAGRGFVVIAAVTFGRWMPVGASFACLFIALAYGLQFFSKAKDLPVPYQLFDALPYMLALAVLWGVGGGSAAPAKLGIPYRRNQE